MDFLGTRAPHNARGYLSDSLHLFHSPNTHLCVFVGDHSSDSSVGHCGGLHTGKSLKTILTHTLSHAPYMEHTTHNTTQYTFVGRWKESRCAISSERRLQNVTRGPFKVIFIPIIILILVVNFFFFFSNIFNFEVVRWLRATPWQIMPWFPFLFEDQKKRECVREREEREREERERAESRERERERAREERREKRENERKRENEINVF